MILFLGISILISLSQNSYLDEFSSTLISPPPSSDDLPEYFTDQDISSLLTRHLKDNQPDLFWSLLKKHPHLINCLDHQDIPLLHSALLYDRIDVALQLINEGADLNLRSKYGNALVLATRLKITSLIPILLHKGADIFERDSLNNNSVYYTNLHSLTETRQLFFSHMRTIRLFFQAIFDNNVDSLIQLTDAYPFLLSCKNNYQGSPPLHFAIQHTHTDMITLLLSLGVDINKKNHEGNTALHFAVSCNKPFHTQTLIEKGSPLDSLNNKNMTPFQIASHMNLVPILKLFPSSSSHSSSNNFLYQALLDNDIRLVQELLDKGADLNYKPPCQTESIFFSFFDSTLTNHTTSQYFNLLTYIFSLPYFDINKKNEKGSTLLLEATLSKAPPNVLIFLLEHQANPYLLNNEEVSSFGISVFQKNFSTLNLFFKYHPPLKLSKYNFVHLESLYYFFSKLIRHHESLTEYYNQALSTLSSFPQILLIPSILNKSSQTQEYPHFLDLAIIHKNTRILKLLLQYNSILEQINQKNNVGDTPLMTALKKSPDYHIILTLLQNGATPLLEDHSEPSPLDWAQQNIQSVDILNLLRHFHQKLTFQQKNIEFCSHNALLFHSLIAQGQIDPLKKLLQDYPHFIHTPSPDSNKLSPLQTALLHQQYEIALFLVDNEAPLEYTNQKGETALIFAIKNNPQISPQDILFLLQKGSLTYAQDQDQKNTLDYAEYHQNLPLYHLLLEFSDIQILQNRNPTFKKNIRDFYFAIQNGHLETVQKFLNQTAQYCYTLSPSHQTAIQFAINHQKPLILQELLQKHPSLELSDILKDIQLCVSINSFQCLKILTTHFLSLITSFDSTHLSQDLFLNIFFTCFQKKHYNTAQFLLSSFAHLSYFSSSSFCHQFSQLLPTPPYVTEFNSNQKNFWLFIVQNHPHLLTEPNKKGQTFFHIVVKNNNLAILKILLNFNVFDLNQQFLSPHFDFKIFSDQFFMSIISHYKEQLSKTTLKYLLELSISSYNLHKTALILELFDFSDDDIFESLSNLSHSSEPFNFLLLLYSHLSSPLSSKKLNTLQPDHRQYLSFLNQSRSPKEFISRTLTLPTDNPSFHRQHILPLLIQKYFSIDRIDTNTLSQLILILNTSLDNIPLRKKAFKVYPSLFLTPSSSHNAFILINFFSSFPTPQRLLLLNCFLATEKGMSIMIENIKSPLLNISEKALLIAYVQESEFSENTSFKTIIDQMTKIKGASSEILRCLYTLDHPSYITFRTPQKRRINISMTIRENKINILTALIQDQPTEYKKQILDHISSLLPSGKNFDYHINFFFFLKKLVSIYSHDYEILSLIIQRILPTLQLFQQSQLLETLFKETPHLIQPHHYPLLLHDSLDDTVRTQVQSLIQDNYLALKKDFLNSPQTYLIHQPLFLSFFVSLCLKDENKDNDLFHILFTLFKNNCCPDALKPSILDMILTHFYELIPSEDAITFIRPCLTIEKEISSQLLKHLTPKTIQQMGLTDELPSFEEKFLYIILQCQLPLSHSPAISFQKACSTLACWLKYNSHIPSDNLLFSNDEDITYLNELRRYTRGLTNYSAPPSDSDDSENDKNKEKDNNEENEELDPFNVFQEPLKQLKITPDVLKKLQLSGTQAYGQFIYPVAILLSLQGFDFHPSFKFQLPQYATATPKDRIEYIEKETPFWEIISWVNLNQPNLHHNLLLSLKNIWKSPSATLFKKFKLHAPLFFLELQHNEDLQKKLIEIIPLLKGTSEDTLIWNQLIDQHIQPQLLHAPLETFYIISFYRPQHYLAFKKFFQDNREHPFFKKLCVYDSQIASELCTLSSRNDFFNLLFKNSPFSSSDLDSFDIFLNSEFKISSLLLDQKYQNFQTQKPRNDFFTGHIFLYYIRQSSTKDFSDNEKDFNSALLWKYNLFSRHISHTDAIVSNSKQWYKNQIQKLHEIEKTLTLDREDNRQFFLEIIPNIVGSQLSACTAQSQDFFLHVDSLLRGQPNKFDNIKEAFYDASMNMRREILHDLISVFDGTHYEKDVHAKTFIHRVAMTENWNTPEANMTTLSSKKEDPYGPRNSVYTQRIIQGFNQKYQLPAVILKQFLPKTLPDDFYQQTPKDPILKRETLSHNDSDKNSPYSLAIAKNLLFDLWSDNNDPNSIVFTLESIIDILKQEGLIVPRHQHHTQSSLSHPHNQLTHSRFKNLFSTQKSA